MSLYSQYSTHGLAAAVVVVTITTLYNILGRVLRHHLVSTQTILNDIPKLGQLSNQAGKKIRGTAVISGGSIAGLWTARVCADYFEKVVVIEPETWIYPDQNNVDAAEYTAVETRQHDGLKTVINKRTRVWQYHGTHGYQPLNLMAFRKLFSRFDEVARSMKIGIQPCDAHLHMSGIPLNAPHDEYRGNLPEVIVATRASLETLLRKLVRESEACCNVHFLNGTVTGIVPSSTKPNRLEGVQVRLDGQKESQLMTGELFLDCTGPTHAFFKWLPRAGYGTQGPNPLADLQLHYEQRMKYSCAQFHLTPEMQAKLSAKIPPNPQASGSSYLKEGWEKAGWLYILHPVAEIDSKMTFAKKMEGSKRVEITFGGWGLEDAPRNKAQMLEFMHSLVLAPGRKVPPWILDMFEVLCDEENDEPIVGFYPTPSSSYIQYHLASNLPSNFIAVGDAVMQINPVFGQGCSKACIGAVTLNAALSKIQNGMIPDDFGKRFFATQHDRINGLWNQAKEQDYRFSTTKPISGEEKVQEHLLNTQGGFMNAYITTLLKLGQTDQHVSSTLWHLFMLLAPATDLFAPRILVKAAWAKICGVA